MNYQAKMVKMYFGQDAHYMSESKDTLIPIKSMNPTHAANAAARLLADAKMWAEDAGSATKGAAQWMLGTKLFQALQARAMEQQTENPLGIIRCSNCAFRSADGAKADIHEIRTGHHTYI